MAEEESAGNPGRRAGAALAVGKLSICVDGKDIEIIGRKSRALMAYLALSETGEESRERLVGLLWSETEEEKARASLRQALHELRRALDDAGFDGLAADKLAIRIDRSRVAVDLWDIVDDAEAGHAHLLLLACKRPLEGLLEDLETVDPAFRAWLLARRLALVDRVRVPLEVAMRRSGRHTQEREALARAIMNLDPTQEEAARVLIRARAEAGDVGAALGVYKALWDLLGEEYDVEPSKETQELVAAIKLGQPVAGPDLRPAPQSSSQAAPTIAAARAAEPLTQSTGAVLCIQLAGPAHDGKDAKSPAAGCRDMVAGFATEILSRTGGHQVEFRGTDILLEFADTRAATAAAFAIEERSREHN